jgi:hypothetical protein
MMTHPVLLEIDAALTTASPDKVIAMVEGSVLSELLDILDQKSHRFASYNGVNIYRSLAWGADWTVKVVD